MKISVYGWCMDTDRARINPSCYDVLMNRFIRQLHVWDQNYCSLVFWWRGSYGNCMTRTRIVPSCFDGEVRRATVQYMSRRRMVPSCSDWDVRIATAGTGHTLFPHVLTERCVRLVRGCFLNGFPSHSIRAIATAQTASFYTALVPAIVGSCFHAATRLLCRAISSYFQPLFHSSLLKNSIGLIFA
jgi:hypothetical protein